MAPIFVKVEHSEQAFLGTRGVGEILHPLVPFLLTGQIPANHHSRNEGDRIHDASLLANKESKCQ